jgi:phosphonate degradation associated HDIG domain protein
MSRVVEEIEVLFARHGGETYGEGVTQLEHALQTAALAQAEGADDSLVVAALLHDIGHFLQPTDDSYGYHKHDRSGGEWLARRFGPAVSEPVRLHVAAKRYLCTVESDYFGKLSPDSVRSLELQGGLMSADELEAFSANPYHAEAVRLRRYDEAAKDPRATTPDFDHYLRHVAACRL